MWKCHTVGQAFRWDLFVFDLRYSKHLWGVGYLCDRTSLDVWSLMAIMRQSSYCCFHLDSECTLDSVFKKQFSGTSSHWPFQLNDLLVKIICTIKTKYKYKNKNIKKWNMFIQIYIFTSLSDRFLPMKKKSLI